MSTQRYVVACYNLPEAPHERSVCFKKGEKMKLVTSDNAQWWKVEKEDGTRGFVPANYVKMVEPPPTTNVEEPAVPERKSKGVPLQCSPQNPKRTSEPTLSPSPTPSSRGHKKVKSVTRGIKLQSNNRQISGQRSASPDFTITGAPPKQGNHNNNNNERSSDSEGEFNNKFDSRRERGLRPSISLNSVNNIEKHDIKNSLSLSSISNSNTTESSENDDEEEANTQKLAEMEAELANENHKKGSDNTEKSGYVNQMNKGLFRKKWEMKYCVVENGLMNFYKSHKALNKAPMSTLGLENCTVEKTEVKGKPDCIFQITLHDKDEIILFESPSSKSCDLWVKVLEMFCTNERQLNDDGGESNSKSDRKRSNSLKLSNSLKKRDRVNSNDNVKMKDKKQKKDKNKDKDKDEDGNFLNRFFKNRPSADELKSKGILQDVYIGTNLIELCNKENAKIPMLVTKCVEYLEGNNLLNFHGIYRVAGSITILQKLASDINQGLSVDFDEIVFAERTTAVTSLLKSFLRELPQAIIPNDQFEEIAKHAESETIAESIEVLPDCHRETLKYIIRHLARVSEYQSENMMTKTNLAVVFGPTLTGVFGLEYIAMQQKIVASLIEHVDLIK